MTTKYKTKAFVFKKNNVNESDRNFSIFADDFGRLDIFVKAIRKNISKLRSGIDIFYISEIEFIQGKNKKTLTNAVVLEKFSNIYLDLEKFKIANKIGEILDVFIKGEEKEKEIFDLLNEVFKKLNDKNFRKTNYNLIYYYFLWNILSLLGYRSEVKKCVNCRQKLIPYNLYFSGKEGGVVCGKCTKQIINNQKNYPVKLVSKYDTLSNYVGQFNRVNSDIIKILRIILLKDWQVLSKLKVEPSSQKILSDISKNAINSFCPKYC